LQLPLAIAIAIDVALPVGHLNHRCCQPSPLPLPLAITVAIAITVIITIAIAIQTI
jgi:hypothetical protein